MRLGAKEGVERLTPSVKVLGRPLSCGLRVESAGRAEVASEKATT